MSGAYSGCRGSSQTRSPARLGRPAHLVGPGRVRAEEARVHVAQGDQDGAGERGQVHQPGGPLAHGVHQPVGQDQPALGVGVDDLDGGAVHGGEDIAGLDRVAARHVLRRGDDGQHLDRQAQGGDEARALDHRRAAAHVHLHVLHAAGGLDGDAAAVEGHRLAHQARGPRRGGRRAWAGSAARSCAGRSSEPRATPSSAPALSLRRAFSSSTSHSSPGVASASAAACSASAVGVRWLAGRVAQVAHGVDGRHRALGPRPVPAPGAAADQGQALQARRGGRCRPRGCGSGRTGRPRAGPLGEGPAASARPRRRAAPPRPARRAARPARFAAAAPAARQPSASPSPRPTTATRGAARPPPAWKTASDRRLARHLAVRERPRHDAPERLVDRWRPGRRAARRPRAP